MRILHLALRPDWDDALRDGRYAVSTRGASVDEVGYVHASTRSQVLPVAARYYADVDPADLVLLVVDAGLAAAAGSPVRWDPAGNELFPHVVGPIPVPAVVAVLPVSGAPGAPLLPDLDGLEVVDAPPTRPPTT